MGRLSGLGSFLVITLLAFAGLRAAHLFLGAVYPASLPGPFRLESLDDLERHAGFWPHLPFYRPMGLGAGPAEIVAQRRPRPRTRIVWRRDAILELTEWGDGFRPDVAPDARPLPDRPQVIWWEADGAWLAVLESQGRWIRIRTDLGLVELRRIAETLLPYDRLL